MRAILLVGSVTLCLLAVLSAGIAQQGGGKGGPLDEDREILKQIREAYKAPLEVHQDVLDDLRKQYKSPSADREASMIRDVRRLYTLSAEQEAALVREFRKAYEKPSLEQEKRIFSEIAKLEKLPEGAVPQSTQMSQAGRLFSRQDQNGDGALSADEMSEMLRGERGRWDANRDGRIDGNEYWAFYQSRLRWLGDEVKAGKIDLGLKRGGPTFIPEEDRRPTVVRAGKLPPGLPPWFEQFDADKDGQVSLAEWRKAGKDFAEFAAMDHNDDGLLTPQEALRFEAQQAPVANSGERAMHGFGHKKGKKKQ